MRRPAAVLAALTLAVATGHPGRVAAVTLLAIDDSASVVHDHALVRAAPGVLANDVGLLGGTVLLVAEPDHGSLTLRTDGGFTYLPDAGFIGTDVFSYQVVSLGLLPSNTAQVTISVTNAAPVARPDTFLVSGGTLVVPAPGVLANDSDADGDALLAELDGGGVSGSLELDEDGGLRYEPGGGFDGFATFRYRVWDGHAWSAPATVTLTATATPSPSPSPTSTPQPTLLPSLPLPTLPLPTLPMPTLPSLATPTPAPPNPTPRPAAPTVPPSSAPDDDPVAAERPREEVDASRQPDATPRPSPTPNAVSTGGSSADNGDGPGPTAGGTGGLAVRRGMDAAEPGLRLMLGGLEVPSLWFVPAAALGGPGLLVILWVALQVAAGAAWLPAARRLRGEDGEQGAIVRR